MFRREPYASARPARRRSHRNWWDSRLGCPGDSGGTAVSAVQDRRDAGPTSSIDRRDAGPTDRRDAGPTNPAFAYRSRLNMEPISFPAAWPAAAAAPQAAGEAVCRLQLRASAVGPRPQTAGTEHDQIQ